VSKKSARAKKAPLRRYSSQVLDGPERAPSRAMLYAVGFQEKDFAKPQVGVASTWSMVTPCNMHIDQLAREAALGIDKAGGKATIFNTITISDGISMGTEGMKYSLVSREVIADSIETVVGCQGFDGYVAIGGCDKNMPGCMMAITRMNRAAVFVYGGTIMPGCAKLKGEEKDLDVVSVFEAVGKHANGEFSDEELETIYAEARVALCPLRFGAGVKLKVVEAMHRGVPVVTTTVGAQGLPDLSALCDVADEAKSLAVATLRLLSDDRLWLERVSAQENYVRSRFSIESMRLAVTTALADAERSR
jgi:dihydroxy-acid dehydratase